MLKILIWGTGKIAKRMLENGINGEIIGFIVTHKTVDMYQDKRVYSINDMPDAYDFIVVANSFSNEIYYTCLSNKIPLEKVIFLKEVRIQKGYSNIKVIKEILGEKNYADYCVEFDIYEGSFWEEDAKAYSRLNTRKNFEIQKEDIWPVLHEKYSMAGLMGNYFWQDLWAAKRVVQSGVKKHFDIGSRLDGFIAHLLAANIDVTMIDVRPFPGEVEHLHTIVDDATNLQQIPDESIESMSALCSLEHFGLGRYGDPIDPEACFKCFDNISRKIKKDGRLYLSVPIGRERVEFNAHRVFYASTIRESFSPLKLEEYVCVAEGKMEYHADIHKYDNAPQNGEHRYGLFLFVK